MMKKIQKILVIDDEESDLETMKNILEANNYEVVTAMSGEEALEAIKHGDIKVILLDILMPQLSGYELLKIFRERYNHGLKLIYVSIIPEKEVEKKGADGFIQKPFSPESFMKVVKEVLEG